MSACYMEADFDYRTYSDTALREALGIWQAQFPTACGDSDLARRKIAAIEAELQRRALDTNDRIERRMGRHTP